MKKSKLISILLTTSLIINSCTVSLAMDNDNDNGDYSQNFAGINLPSDSGTDDSIKTQNKLPDTSFKKEKPEIPEEIPEITEKPELSSFDVLEKGKSFVGSAKNFVINNKKALMIGGAVTLAVVVLATVAYHYRKSLKTKFYELKKFVLDKLSKNTSSVAKKRI